MSSRVWTGVLLGLAAAGLIAMLSVILVDASLRRSAREARVDVDRAWVSSSGFIDLALSSSARWLRHPSLAEAGAANADGPGAPDVDPAGAFIAPPRELFEVGGVRAEVRRSSR